jgi:apolipoprotein N-acyltransferase
VILSILPALRRLAGRRAIFAAFGLGALAALALPPVYAVPVLLLAIPGLLALLDGAGSWQRAGALGMAWGMGHHVAGLYWISDALLTDPWRWGWLVPIAVPALAVPLAAYIAIAAVVTWWAAPGWPRWLALAGAWVAMELLRGALFTGFPWNLIGSVWAFGALPLQGASLVGAHGLSLATMLLAGLPALGRRAVAGGVVALLAIGGFGAWRLAQPEPAPTGVNVLLVQGNVQQEAKWREDMRWPIFQRYVDLTREGVAQAPKGAPLAVIWPETASPFLLPNDLEARRHVAATLPVGGVLLAGSVRAEWGPDGRAQRVFNSLSAVGQDAALLGTYDKVHLVPFGEYMPLRGLIPIRVVQGGLDFSAGPGLVAMTVPGLPSFTPLICYEVIFPGGVVPEARPQWLLNITNDAWFGFSAGPFQHLAAARLRSVEEGLPLARAAQTGISAVFDAHGRVAAYLALGRMGFVTTPLPPALPPTVAARLGLWIPVILVALALLCAAFGSRRRAGIKLL